MIEGPDERYQIATSLFHCILSASPNEAAYNTYSVRVMEIRIAGSSCRRLQLLFDQIYLLFIFIFLLEDKLLPNTQIELNIEIQKDSNLIWRAGGANCSYFNKTSTFVPRLTFNSEGQKLYMENYLLLKTESLDNAILAF